MQSELFTAPPAAEQLDTEIAEARSLVAQLSSDLSSTPRSAQRRKLERRLRDAELMLAAPHLSRKDRERYATTLLGVKADQTQYNRDGTPKKVQKGDIHT
jgi:hypothetical protein